MIRRVISVTGVCQRCSANIAVARAHQTILPLAVINEQGGIQSHTSTQQHRNFTGTASLLKKGYVDNRTFRNDLSRRKIEIESLIDELDIKEITAHEDIEIVPTVPGFRASPGTILTPTPKTHEHLYGETPYKRLPIAHVGAKRNNTLITITDYTCQRLLASSSAGIVGFRNAKQRTTVAAMAVGIDAGKHAMKQDENMTHIRVSLKGLGPGREAAVQGLEKSGLNIVSLTDVSVIDWGSRKGRKQKRGKS